MGDDHDLVLESLSTMLHFHKPTHLSSAVAAYRTLGSLLGKMGTYVCVCVHVCVYTCACMCESVCVCVGMLSQSSSPTLCNLLLCLWDFSSKTTGVGGHSLLYLVRRKSLAFQESSSPDQHLLLTFPTPPPCPAQGDRRFMKLFLWLRLKWWAGW